MSSLNTPEIMFPHLNIQIDHLSKEAFSIGSLSIYWYSIIIITGIFVAYYVATYDVRKKDPKLAEMYTDFLLFAIIFCVIGARLYFVIFSWDYYKDHLLEILFIRNGGLAIYGAVIAAVITAYVFTKYKKISFLHLADIGAPGLMLGQAIGRFGNFVNREAFGGYTDSLFAVRYLKSQVNDIPPSVMQNTVFYNGAEYIQVHPTFLYESVWNMLFFTIIMLYRKHKKFEGEIFCLYLLTYGVGRFFIESMRTDQLILFNTGIPVSMVVSVIIVIVAIVCIFIGRKRKGEIYEG